MGCVINNTSAAAVACVTVASPVTSLIDQKKKILNCNASRTQFFGKKGAHAVA
jgi:hypothetical protein